MALCKCGCGQEVIQKRSGRTSYYLWGHAGRGKHNTWKARPDSNNRRTLRWRAHSLISTDICAMGHIGACKGPIQVHHIDKDVMNNDLSNLVAVCVSHHRLLDNGRITLQSAVMPEYYVDGSGKRRYRRNTGADDVMASLSTSKKG